MTKSIVDLDVRPILLAKEEPFQVIMSAVNNLQEDEVLQLHATFEPTPLLKVLGKKGFDSVVQKEGPEHFIVQFYKGSDKGSDERPFYHIDNRGLEPPQPMVRTLELLDNREAFQEGSIGLEIWNERVPAFLLPELEDRQFSYNIQDLENGTVIIQIYR